MSQSLLGSARREGVRMQLSYGTVPNQVTLVYSAVQTIVDVVYSFLPHRYWLFSRYSTGWKCGLHADYTELTECLAAGKLDELEDSPSPIKRRFVQLETLFIQHVSFRASMVACQVYVALMLSTLSATCVSHMIIGALKLANAVVKCQPKGLISFCVQSSEYLVFRMLDLFQPVVTFTWFK